jgi:hypothetical protein
MLALLETDGVVDETTWPGPGPALAEWPPTSKAAAEEAVKNPARNIAARTFVRAEGEQTIGETSEFESAVFMNAVSLARPHHQSR